MAKYEIILRQSVLKDLDRLPKQDVRRITTAIQALAEEPRPPQSRKLIGQAGYRLRCGVYRILYTIEDRQLLVYVVKVGHRKDMYRN